MYLRPVTLTHIAISIYRVMLKSTFKRYFQFTRKGMKTPRARTWNGRNIVKLREVRQSCRNVTRDTDPGAKLVYLHSSHNFPLFLLNLQCKETACKYIATAPCSVGKRKIIFFNQLGLIGPLQLLQPGELVSSDQPGDLCSGTRPWVEGRIPSPY